MSEGACFVDSTVQLAIKEVSAFLSVKLKDKQLEAVLNFCMGQDVFVSLPTGYGKSMIYGVLPLVFNKIKGVDNSIAVCISPLTAIMVEQSARFSSVGITAEYVGEMQQDPAARARVLAGEVNLVFVSPESIICNLRYRNMLLTTKYKENLVAIVVDEAHCVKTWGEYFRKAFGTLGELRSLIPNHVNIMALTATATQETLSVVTRRLSLKEPVIVAVSPNRVNIKLIVKPAQKLVDFARELAEDLKKENKNYPKTVVFCNSYNDCSYLYTTVVQYLGKQKTTPPGFPNLLEYRLLSMYTRASTDCMKRRVMSLFSLEQSTLRVVIATAAFSMGIDIPDIEQIIHWGPPSDIEQYVQEIGRAGRGDLNAIAILVNKGNRYAVASMLSYVKNEVECRRLKLYKQFVKYEHSTSTSYAKCRCCDICAMSCNCEQCG